jgi:hypothetical protein
VSGFRYLLGLDTGEAADPGAFVTTEPSGLWKVGDTFFAAGGRSFRILEKLRPPEGDLPEAAEWHGVWVVEPS